MYCLNCGVHNEKGQKQCHICHATLTEGLVGDQTRIFVDLSKAPLAAILKSFKNTNPVLAIIIIPFFIIMHFFKRAVHKPFLAPLLNSRTQKYRVTQVNENSNIHKSSYRTAMSFFQQNGFKPLIDLEDLNMTQVMLRKIMFNPEQKTFGTISILKGTGRVTYVTFHAITSKKTYIEATNEYGFPIRYPKNCIIRYLPDLSMDDAYLAFLEIFKETGETAVAVPLKNLLPIHHKVTQFSIDQGLKQGVFQTKTTVRPSRFGQTTTLHMCSFHPLNAAVRKCSKCNTPVCEACYSMKGDLYYCDNCLSDATDGEPPPLPGVQRRDKEVMMPAGFHFAGFGVRLMASIIDFVIIGLITTMLFCGLWYVTGNESKAVPFTIAQFFLVSFTLWYFIMIPSKYGLTAGKKIFGLRIIDRQGKNPDKVASVVRFAYYILTCLFIFPVLGYLFIPFKKTRQGLHDRLAETFVITRSPLVKAILSWGLLIVPLLIGGWLLFQTVSSYVTFDYTPKITLEKKWSFPTNNSEGYIHSAQVIGNRCVLSTSTSLVSLDIPTGGKIWENNDFAKGIIYPADNEGTSLLIIRDMNDEGASLACIRSESGSVEWVQSIDMTDPVVVTDSRSVLMYGRRTVCEYSKDGRLLWEKQFPETDIELFGILNKDILISIHTAESQSLMYLARNSGETLWSMKDSKYSMGPNLGNGHQIVYTPEGHSALLRLPDQKILWQLPENIYLSGHAYTAAEEGQLPPFLYTHYSVIRTLDGSLSFKYPLDNRLICCTDRFLITSPDKPTSIIQTPKVNMLLIDKSTGELKIRFPETNWISLFYIMENDREIYLLANGKVKKAMHGEMVILNKSTFELHRIPIGENIFSPANFKVFPQTNTVFIQTFKDVGLYVLPKEY